ncbi:TonB-dependent receptor plug domain-containing protein [Inmirania thermothiophila]|uniref:Iron complex outermembrane receptor protein n=1 Tax=Inmirania thermothiophila TaxID=1750597 RepID=A0A3N1XZL7_9GAMM|nr:TonB-dependent receptor [Inmirania thermothiophila]ROR32020.1 iron complex outermembrane receptor protein [Inmirania thermothiophila]
MRRATVIAAACLPLVLAAGAALAQGGTAPEGLLDYLGGEDMVAIATGRSQPLRRAPAVASVITAEDLRAMGARDLGEALEAVPGVHVSVSPAGYNAQYLIRGIYTEVNPQVLVLVNGVPITNVFTGNRGQSWGSMPVEAIERIEVIRGPGSALYGADAFAGVVNVVTKGPDEIRGVALGARAGRFDSAGAWFQTGGEWAGFRAALSLEADTTDGGGRTIGADAQTALDGSLTSASLAPGPAELGLDRLDAWLTLARGPWLARLGAQLRRNGGIGAGAAQALDPEGEGEGDRLLLDVTWHRADLRPDWDLTVRGSFLDLSNKTDLQLFPPGAAFLVGKAAATGAPGCTTGETPPGTALCSFPDGVLGNPWVFERHGRLEVSAFYTGIRGHDLRLGAGWAVSDLYRSEERKNFVSDPATGFPVPLGGLVDVSDTDAVFVPEKRRTLGYVFVQDEWGLARDWNLTWGARYDHYSDFGGTFNPRLALVWDASVALTAKFLYGRAFRAPSFAEQFNVNNPVALGNPDLEPETIDTWEGALEYRPAGTLRIGANVFYYRWRDIIRFVPTGSGATARAANSGEQTGYGMEAELDWRPAPGFALTANLALQRARDEDADADPGHAPRAQLYLRGAWNPRPRWSVSAQANAVLDRNRAPDDPRSDEVDDYATADLVLRHELRRGLELAASVRNLFDADAREPSPAPGLIPDDLPLPGRSWFVEVRYRR